MFQPLLTSQLEKPRICGIGDLATTVDHDMSVHPPQAEIHNAIRHFSNGPDADISGDSFSGYLAMLGVTPMWTLYPCASRTVVKRIYQQGKGRRGLAAAWVPEVIS
jgi:hypothetical protein